MPAMQMVHDTDPAEAILDKIGDLSGIDIYHGQVLVAVYMRPKDGKTKGGIYLPQQHTDEDRWQSKVGLLVKAGPKAFINDERWQWEKSFEVGADWLVFRPSDGWNITVNGVLCRVIDDINIRGRVPHPDMVW